jgi:hypothetical protein
MRRHALIGLLGMSALAAFGTGCFHHQQMMDDFERRVADRCVEAAAGRPAVYVIPSATVVTAPPAAPAAIAPAQPR